MPTEYFAPEAKSALSHNAASCTDANPLFSPTLEPTPTSVPAPIPTVFPGNPSRSPTFYPSAKPTPAPSVTPTQKPVKVKKTPMPTTYEESGSEVSWKGSGSHFHDGTDHLPSPLPPTTATATYAASAPQLNSTPMTHTPTATPTPHHHQTFMNFVFVVIAGVLSSLVMCCVYCKCNCKTGALVAPV